MTEALAWSDVVIEDIAGRIAPVDEIDPEWARTVTADVLDRRWWVDGVDVARFGSAI